MKELNLHHHYSIKHQVCQYPSKVAQMAPFCL